MYIRNMYQRKREDINKWNSQRLIYQRQEEGYQHGTAKDSAVPYKRGRILANETTKLKQGMAGLGAAVSYMYVHTIDLFSQKQTTLVFLSTYVIHSI